MLLPSAFSCDTSHPPLTRLQSSLFASPPASPPQVSAGDLAINTIFNSCRSLQSLLAAPALAPVTEAPITPPHSSHSQQQQLPTPPMTHAASPIKLRLRSRNATTPSAEPVPVPLIRRRIAKRAAVVTRGVNKRRRAVDDDMGRRDDGEGSETEFSAAAPQEEERGMMMAEEEEVARPTTPKRARVAPEVIPLGLERSDYHELHRDGVFGEEERRAEGTGVVVEADGEPWSTEEDRILVELVLEKLKLSKEEWQDCARSLGKDRSSVGRRWKSLMIAGDVGLKRSSRRSKLHGTWR
ncbi:hypothetical protein QBC39DRAFT_377587 [Podospora conica]|nr:hypothetical protein QBC39DRAFT_377587 [Schizothecium conicum]